MSRPARARLVRSRHGTLTVRFRWQGRSVWEGTGRPDTPRDRRELEALCARITDELRRGVFDARAYLAHFPHGNLAARLVAPATPRPTVRAYAEEWLERQRREGMKRVTWNTYRGQLHSFALPCALPDGLAFGELRLDELSRRRMIQLRSALLGRVSVQTAKNVVAGAVRRLVGAARDEELLLVDPFAAFPRWPRRPTPAPDPFSREERDRIIAATAAHWQPLVFWLFHTGMRPSEAVALRWGDVHLGNALVRVQRSRTADEEHEPKHAGAHRTIQVVRAALERVSSARRVLRPGEADYLFTDPAGAPVDQRRVAATVWAAALQAAGVRPRKFYATRHTFLSVAVSLGRNLRWLATYAGTSVRMIERHYSLYLPDVGGEQLEVLEAEARGPYRSGVAAGDGDQP